MPRMDGHFEKKVLIHGHIILVKTVKKTIYLVTKLDTHFL